MKQPRIHIQLILGALLAVLLVSGPAQAWPVVIVGDSSPTSVQRTITSVKSFVEDLKRNIDEARRWIRTVEQYARELENWARSITNLEGILSTAEEMIAHKNNLLASMSSLGQTVRGIFNLRTQLQWMVDRRIIALKNIYERTRRGIFNQQANLNDLENYLRTAIGRGSTRELATLERLAGSDPELQRWYEELQEVLKDIALEEGALASLREQLDAELRKTESQRSPTTIQSIGDQRSGAMARLERLRARESELTSLIQERSRLYNVTLGEMVDFGSQIRAEREAWEQFMILTEEAIEELDALSELPARQPVPTTIPPR